MMGHWDDLNDGLAMKMMFKDYPVQVYNLCAHVCATRCHCLRALPVSFTVSCASIMRVLYVIASGTCNCLLDRHVRIGADADRFDDAASHHVCILSSPCRDPGLHEPL